MDILYIKIGDFKIQMNFTSSFEDFKQQVAIKAGTSEFNVLYCQDEDFEKLDYTEVNSQEEFKEALKIIKRLNRFFKIELISSDPYEVISSLESSVDIKNSSFQVLYNNRDFVASLINSSVQIDNKNPKSYESSISYQSSKSYESSKTSQISSEKKESMISPVEKYKYENPTFNIINAKNREKALLKKRKKFSIEPQEGISISPRPELSKKTVFKIGKCSNCKQFIKTEFYKCTHCTDYSLCPSCPRTKPHKFTQIELSKEGLINDLIKKFLVMGFTDVQKIQELLFSTNLSYTRTLTALLGY